MEAPNLQHLAIWRYEKADINGKELVTQSLLVLRSIVDMGKSNSHEAKEETVTDN